MIDPNLDHVGLVVPELEPAMAALSAQLGLEWMGIFEPTLAMRDAEHGTRDVQLRIAVTAQYPRLELIQTIPDSPWALVESGMLLHHLAYYTGDLAADRGRARSRSMVSARTGRPRKGSPTICTTGCGSNSLINIPVGQNKGGDTADADPGFARSRQRAGTRRYHPWTDHPRPVRARPAS